MLFSFPNTLILQSHSGFSTKTEEWEDAFRREIVAPPNDARKRDVIRKWFDRRPNDVKKISD
jgi:hypothetical protein